MIGESDINQGLMEAADEARKALTWGLQREYGPADIWAVELWTQEFLSLLAASP